MQYTSINLTYAHTDRTKLSKPLKRTCPLDPCVVYVSTLSQDVKGAPQRISRTINPFKFADIRRVVNKSRGKSGAFRAGRSVAAQTAFVNAVPSQQPHVLGIRRTAPSSAVTGYLSATQLFIVTRMVAVKRWDRRSCLSWRGRILRRICERSSFWPWL